MPDIPGGPGEPQHPAPPPEPTGTGLGVTPAYHGPGTGGSGASAEAKARSIRDHAASFRALLRSWGIPLSPNLENLIGNAAQGLFGMDTFLEALRKTPDYHKAFRGIFDKDGTMLMSEAQYISTLRQYGDVASRYGLNLSLKQQQWAIHNEVTPSELSDRADALNRVQRNPDLYRAFQHELVQGGLAKQGEVNKKELLKFTLGQANRAWYDLWNDTVTRNAAVQASLVISKTSHQFDAIKQHVLEQISSKGLTETQMTQGFQQLAESLLTNLPEAHIQGLDLSKQALIKAVFGGKGSAEARLQLARIQGNAKAANEDVVDPNSFVNQRGNLEVQGVAKQTYTG